MSGVTNKLAESSCFQDGGILYAKLRDEILLRDEQILKAGEFD